MKTIWMVTTNNGDGSNSTQWVKERSVLDKMQELADNGDERYASGDGLQVTDVQFPDDFDVESWVGLNFYGFTTMEDVDYDL